MSTPYNRTIQAIVIHHPGDGLPPEVPIEGRWNPEGYEYPAYDYAVEADGSIKTGRPLNILGAHTECNKEPFLSRYGQWWFNQHAIGIVVSGDFTKYIMGTTQFNALVGLVKSLMAEYGLTLDNVYPHGQVYTTDCPGCVYDKVPELQGGWNYNEFEQAVLGNVQEVGGGEGEMLKDLVVYADGDFATAALKSYELQCPMVHKDFAGNIQAENKHWIGVQGTNENGNFYYAGSDRIATAKAAL